MELSKRQFRWMLGALLTFSATAGLSVVINAGLHGWHLNTSISRYVGMETWSALMFGLGNILVVTLIGKYLYAVGRAWQLPRWYYWLVVLMAVGLLGVSVCPMGYFSVRGLGTLPDRIHELSSRTMFICMLLVALVVAFCRRAGTGTRIASLVFALYGLFCVAGYLSHAGWFSGHLLVFETVYIIGFMIVGLGFQTKIRNKVKKVERSKHGRQKTD